MTKIKAVKKKVATKKVNPETRIIEIKARMFDLMAYRDAENKKIAQELKSLHEEMQSLTP